MDAARLQLVRLLELVRQLGDSLSLPLGLLLLFHFVLQTLSLYALFGQLSDTRALSQRLRLPCLGAGVVVSGLVVYVCCDTGHRVAAVVNSSQSSAALLSPALPGELARAGP